MLYAQPGQPTGGCATGCDLREVAVDGDRRDRQGNWLAAARNQPHMLPNIGRDRAVPTGCYRYQVIGKDPHGERDPAVAPIAEGGRAGMERMERLGEPQKEQQQE